MAETYRQGSEMAMEYSSCVKATRRETAHRPGSGIAEKRSQGIEKGRGEWRSG